MPQFLLYCIMKNMNIHDLNVGLDVQRLVFKQGVKTFFVRLDRGVEHLVDVLHAAVEVFSLDAERAHSRPGEGQAFGRHFRYPRRIG